MSAPHICSGSRRRARARFARTIAGLTLLEIVVALTVLGVGILTLADATAAMQRRVLRDAWRLRAAELLVSRVESARATPCHSLDGGERELSGIDERWEIVRDSPLVHLRTRVVISTLAPPISLELPVTLWCGGG